MHPRSLSPRLDCLFHVTNRGLHRSQALDQNVENHDLDSEASVSTGSMALSEDSLPSKVQGSPSDSPVQVIKLWLRDCRAAEVRGQNIKTMHNVLLAGYQPARSVTHRILADTHYLHSTSTSYQRSCGYRERMPHGQAMAGGCARGVYLCSLPFKARVKEMMQGQIWPPTYVLGPSSGERFCSA